MREGEYDNWRLYQEYVRCGNPRCRSCPHGPYWYGYREAGGKTRKRYFGKNRPGSENVHPKTQKAPQSEPLPAVWDRIFEKGTANTVLASEILGMPTGMLSRRLLDGCFKKASLANHPDRGGSNRRMAAINCAYSYLKSLLPKN